MRIERVNDATKTYEIPSGTDGWVEITVPEWDCMDPKDVEKIDEKLVELELSIAQSEGVRHALIHFNPSAKTKKAIESLVTRQLLQIGNDWASVAAGDVPGEGSSPSTDS